jgi:hypothetical protein
LIHDHSDCALQLTFANTSALDRKCTSPGGMSGASTGTTGGTFGNGLPWRRALVFDLRFILHSCFAEALAGDQNKKAPRNAP